MNIPQEIKDKIEDKYPYIGEGFGNASLREAASFGYQLAQEEIERLKRLLDLTEEQRKAWANLCIKKQARIEELENPLTVASKRDRW